MSNKNQNKPAAIRKRRWLMTLWGMMVMLFRFAPLRAFAEDTQADPLTIVNNFSDFIFSAIQAIGVIILGWGIVQIGMSVQSHDASQRTQGFFCLFGGLMIAFAKQILTSIGVM